MHNVTVSPPKFVVINGTEYKINFDFTVWIEISILLQDLDFEEEDERAKIDNLKTIIEIFKLAFREIPNEAFSEVFGEVIRFYKGYPKVDNGYSSIEDGDGTKLFSFKHDINYIILAIRNQSGIDLTYNRDRLFHWWDFMLEFQSLEERHYISKIIGYRAYNGEDKDYVRLRNIHALPREITKSDQRFIDEVNSLFYNA